MDLQTLKMCFHWHLKVVSRLTYVDISFSGLIIPLVFVGQLRLSPSVCVLALFSLLFSIQESGKMQNSLSVSDSDGSPFVPLVVLELTANTEPEAIKWLLNRIRDKQRNGGKTPIVR